MGQAFLNLQAFPLSERAHTLYVYKRRWVLPRWTECMRFDQVVSLGGWCVVTENMRHLQVAGPSGPFDYVGFEFDQLIELFANDAQGLAEHVVSGGQLGSVLCQRYECVLTHEFRRDQDNAPIVDDRAVELCARRLQRRWSTLKRACSSGKKTLFVRAATFGDARSESGYTPETRTLTANDVVRLQKAITSRFPDLPFEIAIVYHEEIHPLGDMTGVEDCIFYPMPLPDFDSMPVAEHWRGNVEEWKTFADRLVLPRGAAPASSGGADLSPEACGWTLTRDLEAHLEVDGRRVDPVVRGTNLRFRLPRDAKDVWLVSPTARPCDTQGTEDWRELGLCIGSMRIEGRLSVLRHIALADPSLSTGFHGVEDGARRWTSGRARLPADLWGRRMFAFYLSIDLAGPPVPRWTAPPAGVSSA